MTNAIKRFGILAVCVVVSVVFLTGCSGRFGSSSTSSQEQATTPYSEATSYVSQIKAYADTLSSKSAEFTTAVSGKDTVTIRLKLSEMTDALQSAADLSVPDSIKDEGEKYSQACKTLKDVISEYGNIICTAIEGGGSVNDTDTLQKLSDLQTRYEEAAKSLESADSSLDTKLESLQNPTSNK
jgi:hypothetical protein